MRISVVLLCLGAACVGIGILGLLDSYWRWIGVALGYPPLVSGSVGSVFLLLGITCLAAASQKPGGAGLPDAREDAKQADQDRPA